MNNFLVYLLKSGACLALFYGFYWLFLRREAFFGLNRAILLVSAAFSLLLPLFRIPSPFFKVVVPAHLYGPGQISEAPSSNSLLPILVVYLAGAGIFSLLFLVRLVSLYLAARRCGCERHRGLRVVVCGSPGEPFSFFNYVFLDKSRISDRDFDRILAHELAHIRQRHSVDIILSELLAIFQWFNPFVWPYKRSLRETHEYLADRAVIAQGCGLAGYQQLIIEQLVGGKLLGLASNFRNSQVKRRLIMLSKGESKGLTRLKPLLLLPLAMGIVLAFAESRVTIQGGADTALGQAEATGHAQGQSSEENQAALKEKWEELNKAMKENTLKLEELKAALEKTSDPAEKDRLKMKMKKLKIMAMELDAKGVALTMKKMEAALNQESDPVKKAELEKKLKDLKMKSDELEKKLEASRPKEGIPVKEPVKGKPVKS